MNFLTEHGIGSYEELVERCNAVSAASIRTREGLRDVEQGRTVDGETFMKELGAKYGL